MIIDTDKIRDKVIAGFKGILLFAVVVYSAFTLFRTSDPTPQLPVPDQMPEQQEDPGSSCSRTQPYKLDPEFERAISLIKQRERVMHIQLFGSYTDKWIYNCLFVEYGDVGQSEGVFYFDDRVSNLDKLVIQVSPTYKNSDDLLTALLLYHEIQHAGQYVTEKKHGTKLGCIRDETMSFHWQYQFFRWLNEEERKSIVGRVYYGELSNTPVHTQIEMLEQLAVFSNKAANTCTQIGKQSSWDCYVDQFVPQVEGWVKKNPHYEEQCKGDL